MLKNDIRKAIALDLKGRPSRNTNSLLPEMAKNLGIETPDVLTHIQQMSDNGHLIFLAPESIRLTEAGEKYYFASKRERVIEIFKRNWPHITSNTIAVVALAASLWNLIKNNP